MVRNKYHVWQKLFTSVPRVGRVVEERKRIGTHVEERDREHHRPRRAARELRRHLLRAFPALAVSPGQAAKLMPRLYSALLDSDVGIRATAIDVCRRWVPGPGYALPELVRAFVPTLLDDTYVAVHRAMIRAISAVPPLRGDVRRIVLSLLDWAGTYATRDPI